MTTPDPQDASERIALSFFTADDLGRIVREAWTEYARLAGDTKPEHLVSWEYLSEYDREADRRIGLAVRDAIAIDCQQREAEWQAAREQWQRSDSLKAEISRQALAEVIEERNALEQRCAALEAAPKDICKHLPPGSADPR